VSAGGLRLQDCMMLISAASSVFARLQIMVKFQVVSFMSLCLIIAFAICCRTSDRLPLAHQWVLFRLHHNSCSSGSTMQDTGPHCAFLIPIMSAAHMQGNMQEYYCCTPGILHDRHRTVLPGSAMRWRQESRAVLYITESCDVMAK